ncbi:MAG: prolipoprotein diacylglyceryl transferase [Lachnospiraceae bacterium]|nr:prolipoprotein diacylglyceryl transferase [Lachnospiraceae bacterium]
MNDIRFPNLGIVLKNVPDGITIFGFEIKFYGIIIALGFLFAYIIVAKEAKRTGQKDEDYLDLILWLIIPAIVGARLYYVLFRWDDYFGGGRSFKDTLIGVINLRNGGLAIYGGLILGFTVAVIFCKKKALKFTLVADTAVMGILVGQILGRWGNFFNREAFGEYTDSLFAMCLPAGRVSSGSITETMAANLKSFDGIEWISVHPTFLYESLWNVALLILIFIYRKHKKFDGELALLYAWGYGLGRVWIEGLRTDSLYFFNTGLRTSQLLAALCVLIASVAIVVIRLKVVGKSLGSPK